MNERAYFLVCSTIFLVVAAAHLSRLFLGWDILIGGWHAPHWISIPGAIVAGLLAAWGFRLARGRVPHEHAA